MTSSVINEGRTLLSDDNFPFPTRVVYDKSPNTHSAVVALFASAKFRQYDYGRVENKKRYGSRYPPDYPLVKVTAPVYLHYSDNDWLASLQDVNLLHNGLGNAKKLRISHKKFNHLDYLWAIHGKELLYSKVIGCMNCYHSECPENAFCYQPRT